MSEIKNLLKEVLQGNIKSMAESASIFEADGVSNKTFVERDHGEKDDLVKIKHGGTWNKVLWKADTGVETSCGS